MDQGYTCLDSRSVTLGFNGGQLIAACAGRIGTGSLPVRGAKGLLFALIGASIHSLAPFDAIVHHLSSWFNHAPDHMEIFVGRNNNDETLRRLSALATGFTDVCVFLRKFPEPTWSTQRGNQMPSIRSPMIFSMCCAINLCRRLNWKGVKLNGLSPNAIGTIRGTCK